MKLLFALLFISSSAFAQYEVDVDRYVDLIPLQLQYRFEDSTNQEKTNRQYQAYGLGLQYSMFRAEFEYSQFYDNTGNPSLKVEQTITEYDLGLGYRVYKLISDDRRLSFSLFGKIWLGTTRTRVDTSLLTTHTSVDSDRENVLGVGASALLRISYFMLESEFKMLNSKNMSPQNVPVFGVKIGATIPY